MDLAKAFDTVSIPILLRKMEVLGVRGTALDWFSSYLTGRTHRVKVGNNISDSNPVSFGVPQGSILGPTLFIAYMNDILSLELLNGNVLCYADDTALVFYGDSWQQARDMAVLGLRRISLWLNNNLLTLNADKTKFINFYKTAASRPPEDLKQLKVHRISCVTQGNSQISVCTCERITNACSLRYLGVILDENLNFKNHISMTAGRVRKLIYTMKLLREPADTQLLRMVYLALCQSILSYCILVWGGSAKSYLILLERAQRAVLKVSLRRSRRYPTSELFREAQVLSVRRLFLMRAATYVHRQSLRSLDHGNMIHKRIYKISKPRVNTAFAKRFAGFLLPHIYNRLSGLCDLRHCSIKEAESRVHRLLLSWDYDRSEEILRI